MTKTVEPRQTCRYCSTMLYTKVEWLGDVLVESDEQEHTVARCLDVASNRMRQLEHGRGAGYCGYQWGMGGKNHGGGCEQAFADAEAVYRCLNCGGTFHKKCLEGHFAKHSGETPEAEREACAALVESKVSEWGYDTPLRDLSALIRARGAR
jgi:hypothetical protein